MGTSSSIVIERASASKSLPSPKRQYRSPELKREIVEESLVPGASVARIARAHGVNANQVFTWRRKHRQGLLPTVRSQAPGLLAVRVTETAGETTPSSHTPSATSPSGTIQIELAKGTVRLRGQADLEVLRTALEVLTR